MLRGTCEENIQSNLFFPSSIAQKSNHVQNDKRLLLHPFFMGSPLFSQFIVVVFPIKIYLWRPLLLQLSFPHLRVFKNNFLKSFFSTQLNVISCYFNGTDVPLFCSCCHSYVYSVDYEAHLKAMETIDILCSSSLVRKIFIRHFLRFSFLPIFVSMALLIISSIYQFRLKIIERK